MMPAGDGTGPMGQGPMSGRGAGYCAGFQMPGYLNPGAGGRFGYGRGWGRGRGRGPGWRWWRRYGGWGQVAPLDLWPYPAAAWPGSAPTAQQETQALKAQAEQLESALADVRKRIEELSASQQEKE